ncbi:NADH-quinone oxidoreductase subunit J [uncultured Tateyamaria sp.]|uniref:NADH-quinone oxidoreductase subunit J n=1 Tax=uncultured Tateyamaria sp. TaxID=455651 RepID=UPI0026129FFE|nr:NADH-quinone oxidoreductase subunit J [uncultured Tateyamaria sp.]
MSFELFLFYVFAAITVGAASCVITVRNPVHAAMFLVLTFFSTACIWMLLEAEFLAITLVLVYVGAVMVLFLFVVMMLDVNVEPLREGFVKYLPWGAAVGLLMFIEMAFLITDRYFKSENYPIPAASGPDYSNTEMLGRLLYDKFLFQFEVAAVILLVAIIAAIALTMRRRPDTKYQKPHQQVDVKKSDRLRVVQMPSEKR